MKECILFDHDGVLVDTEPWYFRAGERALADIGLVLDPVRYLEDMTRGRGTWAQAVAAGVDADTIDRQRQVRDGYYREYLQTEAIEIDGVLDVLAVLAPHVRMAVVTTARRADFELIHRDRRIMAYMDFVVLREDYVLPKPDPQPYLLGLQRFGIDPDAALAVEDSERGLSSAVAAGIDCAVVDNAFTRTQDFSRARYRISSLAELSDLIAS